MKVALRLLHFILYYFNILTKAFFKKINRLKGTIRFILLLCWHFSTDGILYSKSKQVTKPLTHASIVVNRLSQTRLELLKLAEVISYLMITGATVISVHDN